MGFSLTSKQWKSVGKYLSLFCLCLALVVGCRNSDQPSVSVNQISDGTVAIGTTLKPRTLDPADNYELAGLNIIYNVGETLYTYELGTTELKPLLATEMPQISDDGLVYTIPIRSGVTFHDGTPFDAEAMAFSLRRFIENGGKPSFLLSEIVETVEATDEYELQIRLKQPFAAFVSLLAFPGTSAVSPSAYQIGQGAFNPSQLIGTGPYQLADFSSDSVSLEPNTEYWGDSPANEGVKIQIYADNSANLFNSFLTEAVDVAYQSFDPEQIKSLQQGAEDGKWKTIEAPGTTVNYLVLNTQQEPLNQPEVRQAIAAAIDRSLINQRVLQGQAEPIYSLVPTAFDAYQPAFETVYGEANTTKAKQLLEQAGYSQQNPAVVEIWHSSGSNTRGIVAATLKAYIDQELDGAIQIESNNVQSASFFGNLSKGIYPSALADWYPDFLDPDNYIQPFLACSEGSPQEGCVDGAAQSRGSFYYNERVNQLIEQQRTEQDPQQRQAIFAQIQEILAEDVPYIPLWQTKDYAFAQNNVEGVTINPSQSFPFWTIAK